MEKVASLRVSDAKLTVLWQDDQRSEFDALWLRDHCRMPESRDAASGQRYLDVASIPDTLSIAAAGVTAGGDVEVLFAPEQHRSLYPARWLRENCYHLNGAFDDRSEANKVLWDRDSIGDHRTRYDWAAYLANPEIKYQAMKSLHDLGFFVLHGVPATERQLLKVIRTFGFVRETNYGELFDVRSRIDPNNLAFTNLGLGAHTDNPYRYPLPTIQVLHCLDNDVDGGESILLDGFKAAAVLRAENTAHFDTLANTRVDYRFSDTSADLRARMPMIEQNDRGEVTGVRYNNRSIDTLILPPERVEVFYGAYRHYAEILKRESLMLTFKMDTGDCVIFDNTRMMHARKAFSTGGSRHLQGAYSDLDGAYSTMRVLERELNP